MDNNRQSYIEFGIKNKIPTEGINSALIESGFSPLSKVETLEINEGVFGKGLLPKIGKQFRDIGGGLYTAYGALGQYISDKDTRDVINKNVGEYIKGKGTSDLLADAVNLMGTPYNNLTIDKALTQPIGDTVSDIVAGAQVNPLDATLDFILPSLGVAGKVAKSTKTGGKLLNKGIEVIQNSPIPKPIKSLVKGTREYNINEILNTSKIAPNANIERLSNIDTIIRNADTNNLAQAIQNLEEGIRKGTQEQLELTDYLKTISKDIDDIMISKGLDPKVNREDAIAQYITRQYQKSNKDIPVAEIKRYLRNNDYIPEGLDANKLKVDAVEAERLYDEGMIYPIRHKSNIETQRKGYLSEDTKRHFRKNERIYGTQSYEDLAKGLKQEGFQNTIGGLNKTEQTLEAIDEINRNLGRKVDNLDNLKLANDEVVISPRLLREKLGTSIIQNGDVTNDIKTLSRGLNKDEMARYSDDLYIYTKSDLDALKKAFIPSGNKTDMLTNLAKRSVLSTPRYLSGNATTNIGMNITEGVTPLHYVNALLNKDEIPTALKKTTTFSGYLGKEIKSNSTLKEMYNSIFDKVKNGTALEKLEGIQQLTTTPIFKAAGNIEFLDRGANYMLQAERYAREVGKTVEEILRLAKKNNGNNNTYRLLLERVNNTLGDYSGRNYYAPQFTSNVLQSFTPFYRPYTQAVRQFTHQAIDNPFANQIVNRNPARIGNQISEYGEQELNVTPNEQYGGGYPVLPGYGYMPSRVIGNPYNAYSALGEVFSNPTEALGGNLLPLAPLLALTGRNRYGSEPTLPNQITINGRKVQLDNNGNEVEYSNFDKFRLNMQLAASQSAQAYIAPINQLNNFVLPTIAAFTNQEYRRPIDTAVLGTIGNINIPFISQSDSNSRAKIGSENLLPQLGFTLSDTYPQRRASTLRERARGQRYLNRKRTKNERR